MSSLNPAEILNEFCSSSYSISLACSSYRTNNVLINPSAFHLAWKPLPHTSQWPEAGKALCCRNTCSKVKLLHMGKMERQGKEDPQGPHPHPSPQICLHERKEKERRLECLWWRHTHSTSFTFLKEACESHSQGKIILLGYTFCINSASVETFAGV